jgi:hypothetical protein
MACSSLENKNAIVQDPPATIDTIAVVSELIDEHVPELIDEDTSALEERFKAWKDVIDSAAETLYQVTMSNHQYEATSDITWYFDAEINAVYFSINWSMEGTEGSTERIAKDGSVICSSVQENSTYEKWCQSTGGIRTTVDENSGQETKDYLDAVYGNEQSLSLQQDIAALSAFLQEAKVVEDEGDWVTLRIEKVVNYGEDFTEYAEVRVHRKVYDELK